MMKRKLLTACPLLLALLMIPGFTMPTVYSTEAESPAQVLATPTTVTLQGKIFDDLDTDGVLDGNESYQSLTGMSAVLTSLSGTMSPLNMTVNANGQFRSLDASGAPYYLETGTYKLTIINHNTDLSLLTARGFTPVTSDKHSVIGTPPFGATSWYMDIPQGVPADDHSAGIARDHSTAVYTFEVTESSKGAKGVGIAMSIPVTVTFSAGTGITASFGQADDPKERIFKGAFIQNEVIPSVNENIQSNYDPETLTWILDQDVMLTDATFIADGTILTNTQLETAIITKDLTATASLSLMNYDITYDYAQGTAPETANPTTYNIETVFPIVIANAPARTDYIFEGWTVDYENETLTDITAATMEYRVPAGTTGNIALTAVWNTVPAPNLYTIVYEPGDHGTFDTQTTTHLAEGAKMPAAPSVTGDAHWKFVGWSPSRNDTVTKSVHYVAQWHWVAEDHDRTADEDTDDEEEEDAKSDDNTDQTDPSDDTERNNASEEDHTDHVPGGTGPNSVPGEPTVDENRESVRPPEPQWLPSYMPKPETESKQVDLPQILAISPGEQITLTDVPVRPWALINLILSILGILLAVFAMVYTLTQKKYEKTDAEDDRADVKNAIIQLLPSVCLSILGIVLFLITEPIHNPMAFIDRWTIIHLILLALECLLLTIHLHRKSRPDAERDSFDIDQ